MRAARLLIVNPPPELSSVLEGSVAVVKARWGRESRLLILASLKGSGGRVYVAPPVPSPLCTGKLERLEELLVKRIAEALGLRVHSACRAHRSLVRPSVIETLREVFAQLDLSPVEEEG